jgi:hypothetical protein
VLGITDTRGDSLRPLVAPTDSAVCRRIDSVMGQGPFYSFWAGRYVITTTMSSRPHEFGVTHLWVFDTLGNWIHSPGDGQLVAPQDVHTTSTGAGNVVLQWTSPGTWISTYDVQRAVGEGAFEPFGVALPGTATRITDVTALTGKAYRYRLVAKSAGGNSGYSNEVSLTVAQSDLGTAAPQRI